MSIIRSPNQYQWGHGDAVDAANAGATLRAQQAAGRGRARP